MNPVIQDVHNKSLILQNLIKIDDSAAGRLSHVSKDESFSGLDPVKTKPKYKKPAYEVPGTTVLGHEGEDIKQLHVPYRSEHALEPLGIWKEQRSKDSILSSYSGELASTVELNSSSSTPILKTLHQLTFDSSDSASDTGFRKQNHGGLPSTPSHNLSLQTKTIAKITTLNSHLYDPGSVDSARSTPTESLSTTSSPVLQQAHPVLFPDNFSQGGRRSSVVSLDSTLAPTSPRPSKKRSRPSVHPSQGDAVLISFLGPDQPLVAIRAGESPLPWPSGSESTETEMELGGGGHDGEDGGDSNHNSGSMSRQQSSEGSRGNRQGGNGGSGDTTGGGAAAGGDGGGDERRGGSGDGEKGKENGEGGKDGEEKEGRKKKKKEKENKKTDQTSETDAMDIDEGSDEKPTGKEQKGKLEQESTAKDDTSTGRRDSNAMEVEVSSSETAVSSLMALAGAAGKDQQPSSSGAILPGLFSTTGPAWAPTAHAQTSPGSTDRGPPPSPGPSNQLFQNNKLPPPNSPNSLASIIPSINAQSASSPNSLSSGHDGRPTLPPVSSIHVLADIAEKESSHQQQSSRGYPNRMPPNSRTVYPTVSSHVSVAPSNRSAQAAQSPGLPPPGPPSHGYGPDGNPRPPIHHISMQQRQFYMNQDSSSTPFSYPQHQHYQTYSQIKEGSHGSPNGNSGPYAPTFPHGRELPNIMSSPPATGANFFAQQHMPTTISGRRDSSTLESYYASDHTPPSGPSTGDTMPSSGTDDTVTSPRNRPGIPAGGQQTGSLTAGVFKCEYPGCKAQPFQTQYLLK